MDKICNNSKSTNRKRFFTSRLLEWFKGNNRDFLPWRQTNDPYKILVAELMLQKTTVKQVQQVFAKFIMRYPDVMSLSKAHVRDIKSIITSLGMEHKKAPLFKKLAHEIVNMHNNEVPSDPNALTSLSGIGNYIANSVMCLAFNADLPMLDTNSIRLLNRVFNLNVDAAKARKDKSVWTFLGNLIPKGRGRQFNLAILDFASKVCLSRKPDCNLCPIASICFHHRYTQSRMQKDRS